MSLSSCSDLRFGLYPKAVGPLLVTLAPYPHIAPTLNTQYLALHIRAASENKVQLDRIILQYTATKMDLQACQQALTNCPEDALSQLSQELCLQNPSACPTFQNPDCATIRTQCERFLQLCPEELKACQLLPASCLERLRICEQEKYSCSPYLPTPPDAEVSTTQIQQCVVLQNLRWLPDQPLHLQPPSLETYTALSTSDFSSQFSPLSSQEWKQPCKYQQTAKLYAFVRSLSNQDVALSLEPSLPTQDAQKQPCLLPNNASNCSVFWLECTTSP